MKKSRHNTLFIALSLFASCLAQTGFTAEQLTDEPDPRAYNYSSHHTITIAASAHQIWPQLTDLGAWMYDFEMSHVAGKPGEIGEVLRLYSGQDFLVQIIELVPNELMIMANLPSSFRGETSTGLGVINLRELEGNTEPTTEVRLNMIRRYVWTQSGPNPQKVTRQSEEFQNNTQALWARFLNRLKELAEKPMS